MTPFFKKLQYFAYANEQKLNEFKKCWQEILFVDILLSIINHDL